MSDNLFLHEEAVVIWIKAREALGESKLLIANQRYLGAVTRSYYAAFHMAELLLLTIGKSFRRHEQVIGSFNRHFVNETKQFPEIDKTLLTAGIGSRIDESLSNEKDIE